DVDKVAARLIFLRPITYGGVQLVLRRLPTQLFLQFAQKPIFWCLVRIDAAAERSPQPWIRNLRFVVAMLQQKLAFSIDEQGRGGDPVPTLAYAPVRIGLREGPDDVGRKRRHFVGHHAFGERIRIEELHRLAFAEGELIEWNIEMRG